MWTAQRLFWHTCSFAKPTCSGHTIYVCWSHAQNRKRYASSVRFFFSNEPFRPLDCVLFFYIITIQNVERAFESLAAWPLRTSRFRDTKIAGINIHNNACTIYILFTIQGRVTLGHSSLSKSNIYSCQFCVVVCVSSLGSRYSFKLPQAIDFSSRS